MRYINFGCDINCPDCNKKCNIKDSMLASLNNPMLEQIFYISIMDYIKAHAGYYITRGFSYAAIQEDVKYAAVSFYVARLRLMKELQNKPKTS